MTIRAVWLGQTSVAWTFPLFVAAAVFGPIAFCVVVFWILCAAECTVLPWLLFVLGPAAILLFALPITVWLGVGTYRASQRLSPKVATVVKVVVLASVLWIPVVAFYAFGLVLDAIQGWRA